MGGRWGQRTGEASGGCTAVSRGVTLGAYGAAVGRAGRGGPARRPKGRAVAAGGDLTNAEGVSPPMQARNEAFRVLIRARGQLDEAVGAGQRDEVS